MDLRYSDGAERFRSRLRAIFDAELPPGWRGFGALPPDERAPFNEHWRAVLNKHGLLAVNWPEEYGGSALSLEERVVLSEELARNRLLVEDVALDHGLFLLGPTIMAFGTAEQRAYFLPRILSGEHRWCEGFSEPDAGSDLASLRTNARREGDRFVINGQKIWTSDAHHANWIFLLCRTAMGPSKHAGLSFLLVPLDQPGIEVRPIINMNGGHDYNEVFFRDAETSASNLLGEQDHGWDVALHLLGHERGAKMATHAPMYRQEFDRMLDAVCATGRNNDAVTRQTVARLYASVQSMRWMGLRTLTRLLHGEEVGPEGSMFRLMWSRHRQQLTNAVVDAMGAHAMAPTGDPPASEDVPGVLSLMDLPGAPNSSQSWVSIFLAARSDTIRGGTSQVQMNILAERVLGLPREPRPVPRSAGSPS